MAFYDPTVLELHVLLVDHDVNKLHETSRLLESISYKVTAVDDVFTASSMLSKGKATYDLVMIDITSCNLEGYKLLHEAVSMDVTVILMSTNANATLVKGAIEDGAFLFMEKPTIVGELKYLWQHVLREKTRKSKQKAISRETSACNNLNNYTTGGENLNSYRAGGENLGNYTTTEGMTMNQYVSTNNETCQRGALEHNYLNSENNYADPYMRSKFCTEWTPELHEKFMAAVRQLGEGRCFPKDILDLMNVPGLTRMQVASHLQKCRYGWQPPHERNGRRVKVSKSSSSSDSPRPKAKRYGSFPRLIKGSQPQDNQNDVQGLVAASVNMGISTPFNNTYNMGEQGTFNITTTVSNNGNMNGISSENVLGNMVTAPNQGLESDISLDFLTNYDDALIPNNFSLQDLDYDHSIVPANQTTYGADDRKKASKFWSSWIADFAMD